MGEFQGGEQHSPSHNSERPLWLWWGASLLSTGRSPAFPHPHFFTHHPLWGQWAPRTLTLYFPNTQGSPCLLSTEENVLISWT